MKRQPLKRKNSTLKKGGPIRRKQVTHQQIAERKLQSERDWSFYKEIWEEREHRCTICDDKIYGELKNLYMDHILEKSRYKELRYEKDNIAIVCQHCHSIKTDGYIVEKYQRLIDEVKKKYGVI